MVNFVITNAITTKLYTKNDNNNVDRNNEIVSNDCMIQNQEIIKINNVPITITIGNDIK